MYIAFIYFASILLYIINLNEKNINWIILIAITIIFFLPVFMIFFKRRLPKASKNNTGIIFAIDFSNQNQFDLVNEKFIKKFIEMINDLCELNPEVLILNDFLSSKWSAITLIKNEKKAQQLLYKTNSRILITGSCTSGGDKEEYSCYINLNAAIEHISINTNLSKILKINMSSIFQPLYNIKILKNIETDEFKLNAYQLSLAIEYIIATTMFICEYIELADKLYSNLNAKVSGDLSNIPVIKYVKRNMRECLTCTRLYLAQRECNKFYNNFETKYLINAKRILDNSKTYLDTLTEAKNIYAIFHFWVNRDIKKSLEYIDIKSISNVINIKFSIIFLKLYSNDKLNDFIRVFSVYKKMEELDCETLNNIESFISKILELEPEKKQLNFLLFLIYDYQNNRPLAEKCARMFANNYKNIVLDEKFKITYEKYIHIYNKEFNLINTNFIDSKKENDIIKI
ncbi:MAG TPA: hypothetical protein DCP51_09855 [Clostridiales bacterium]|nr:hypothetical protein [Clostridiales bacterium]